MMFDQEKWAQTVFNMAKDYTTTTMQVMKTSNEQLEKTLDTMVKQGMFVQEESQKLLSDWTNRMKQGQQQYWNIMDENLKRIESYFGTNGQKHATK